MRNINPIKNMTLGVMQPYFFPYLGYWQLLNLVDTYVIYDDVNYIKQGYINRNSILLNGTSHQITLELIGASQNKKINEITVGNNARKIYKTIEQSYQKSPFFKDIIVLIEEILFNNEKNLARFIGNSIIKTSNYLGIETKIEYSSNIDKNNELRAQDKILHICNKLEAKKYINALGGRDLYDKESFEKKGLILSFLKSSTFEYQQFNNKFVPNLSIIDMMMFLSIDEIKQRLYSFEII